MKFTKIPLEIQPSNFSSIRAGYPNHYHPYMQALLLGIRTIVLNDWEFTEISDECILNPFRDTYIKYKYWSWTSKPSLYVDASVEAMYSKLSPKYPRIVSALQRTCLFANSGAGYKLPSKNWSCISEILVL